MSRQRTSPSSGTNRTGSLEKGNRPKVKLAISPIIGYSETKSDSDVEIGSESTLGWIVGGGVAR